MDFFIRIANMNIGIHTIYSNTFKTCKDYLIDKEEQPDIEISTDETMILAEAGSISNTLQSFSTKTLEGFLVHRLIAEALLEYDVFLMHGAVIAINHMSFMFTANSGTGKTTHIMKWLDNVPDSFVVNGDKPFIKVGKDGVLACGSPWAGKERLQTNTIVPLKAIVLLERAEENRIERISFARAFPFLYQQVYRPQDENKMYKTLRLLQRLSSDVSIWRFYCNNFKADSFDVAYRALVGGEKENK